MAALPKVTEYVKNIGKSVAYSTVDYFSSESGGGIAGASGSFLYTNKETFKTLYAAAIDYKGTIKAAEKSIKDSKVYEAYGEGKKALFEDLKTGNFYNRGRIDQFSMKAMGMDDFGDDWDFGDDSHGNDDSFGFNDDDDDWDDEDFDAAKAVVKSNDKLSKSIGSAMDESIQANAHVTIKSASLVADTIHASSKLLYGQNERIFGTVNTGFTGIMNELSRINQFISSEALASHLSDTNTFYKHTTELLEQTVALLKESTEMQRNVYKAKEDKAKVNAYDDVVTAEGVPDLEEYAKVLKKNMKSLLGPEADIIFGGDGNMLLAAVASPLKVLPDLLIKTLVPLSVKKSIEAFDKTISGVFSTMIAKFSTWANNDDYEGSIYQIIGKAFGIEIKNKNKVDTSKYEKGPIPFDGITKKSIVEVIPGHLARIEAALTKTSERVFDYSRGSWTDVETLEKEFKNRKKSAYRSGGYDVMDGVNGYVSELKKKDSFAAKDLEEKLDLLLKKVYDDNGSFKPYRQHGLGDLKQDAYEYYGFDDKKQFDHVVKLMLSNRGNAMNLASEMIDSKQGFNRYLEDAESGYNPLAQLFNGAHKGIKTNSTKMSTSSNKLTKSNTLAKGLFFNERDQHNKNIYDYLRGIYAELIHIRTYGGPNNGGPSTPTRGGRGLYGATINSRKAKMPDDPLAALNNRLGSEFDAEIREISSRENSNRVIADDNFDEENFATEYTLMEEIKAKKAKDDKKKKRRRVTDENGKIIEVDEDDDTPLLRKMLSASTLGQKWKVMQSGIEDLMQKPSIMIAGLFDRADKKVFEMMFGREDGKKFTDKYGNDANGVVNYMILRLQEVFDDVKDTIQDKVLNPLVDWFKTTKAYNQMIELKDKFMNIGLVRDTVDAIRGKMGTGKSIVQGSWDKTYGAAYNYMTQEARTRRLAAMGPAEANGPAVPSFGPMPNWGKATDGGIVYPKTTAEGLIGPMSPSQVLHHSPLSAMKAPTKENNSPLSKLGASAATLASGARMITKRGLAILSPGEQVIPATYSASGQSRQLSKEKAFARQHGIGNAGYYAEGTTAQSKKFDDMDENDLIDLTKTVMKEVSPDAPDFIASSLLGAGASLLTGMIGGPLLGAAAGAAMSIVKNSATAQKLVLGEDTIDKDGNAKHVGGIIPKKFQDSFNKYFPDMRDFGIAGGIASLFGPFGLLGGAAMGSAIGFAKNNDNFMTTLYGPADEKTGERDGGLIKKGFRDKVKAAGFSIGVGALGGALLGPFGLLGNAALGSALGFISTTDEFKTLIFGKEGADGERHGGLAGAIHTGFIKPMVNFGKEVITDLKKFAMKHVVSPLKDFGKPFMQMINNAVLNVTTGIGDFVKDWFDSRIGRPIADFIEHRIFKPIAGIMKFITKVPVTMAKAVIGGPAHALGWIGNNIRSSQIHKGTATDMSAAQRNKWRDTHNIRSNLTPQHDQTRRFDHMLETGFNDAGGIDRMKEMRDQIKMYTKTRKDASGEAAKLVRDCGAKLSDYLHSNNPEGRPTVSCYDAVEYKNVVKMHTCIMNGDMAGLSKLFEKYAKKGALSATHVSELTAMLSDKVAQIAKLRETAENQKDIENNHMGYLSLITGGEVSKRTARNLLRNLDKEIEVREYEDSVLKNKSAEEIAELDIGSRLINESLTNKSNEIIEQLQIMNRTMGMMAKNAGVSVEDLDIDGLTDNDPTDAEESMSEYDQQLLNLSNMASGDADYDNDPTDAEESMSEYDQQLLNLSNMASGDADYDNWRDIGPSSPNMEPGTILGDVTDEMQNAIPKPGSLAERNALIDRVENGYREVTNDEGQTTVVNHEGEAEGGSDDEFEAEIEEDEADEDAERERNEENDSFLFNMKEALFGENGLGAIPKFLGTAKDGLFGIFQSISDNVSSIPIIGDIWNIIKGIGTVIIGGAITGHLAGFWAETIWPVLSPVLDSVWTTVKDIGTQIYSGIAEYLGEDNFLVQGVNNISTAITNFQEDPDKFLEGCKSHVIGWIVDGWSKLWDYVGEPITNGLKSVFFDVLPYLLTGMYKIFKGSKQDYDSYFASVSDMNVDTITNQSIDADGNKEYIDSEGNTTTEAFDEDKNANAIKTSSNSVTTTEYNDSLLNNFFVFGGNDTEYSKSVVDKRTGIEYTMYVSYHGTESQDVTIIYTGTGEYLRYIGLSNPRVYYGYCSNEQGTAIAGGVLLGLVLCIAASAIGVLLCPPVGAAALLSTAKIVGTVAIGSAIVGGIGGGTVYQLTDGSYRSELDISNCDSDKLAKLAVEFGYIDYEPSVWPTFPEVTTGTDYSNYSPSAAAGFSGSDVTKSLPVYNSSDESVYEKDTSSGDYKYMRAYKTDDGDIAYYDVRSSGTDLPAEIKRILGTADYSSNYAWMADMIEDDPTLIKSFPTYGLSKSEADAYMLSGFKRKKKRKNGNARAEEYGTHLYQNNPLIADTQFGNSTIGEAGCGPVAAANMINRLSGRGADPLSTASYAEQGGYIDNTGGTTVDYFTDIFGQHGYASQETEDTSAIASSLKQGTPAVLLGNSTGSGDDATSAFGAGDHYINAYGVDGSGNVIIEDPDLPTGLRTMPLNEVMRDTSYGVLAGLGRKMANKYKPKLGKRRRKSGRASGKASDTAIDTTALSKLIYALIVDEESGGNYAAINDSDGSVFSVGVVQWYAERAFQTLYEIVQSMSSNYLNISSSLWSELSIYSNKSSWEPTGTRKWQESDRESMVALLSSAEGIVAQDKRALIDIEGYIDIIVRKGIIDSAAIMYLADLGHQGGTGTMGTVCNGLVAKYGATSVDLDKAFEGSKSYNIYKNYSSRRTRVYNAIKAMSGLPTSTTSATYDSNSSYATATALTSAADSTFSSLLTNGMSSIGTAVYDMIDSMYGVPIMDFIRGVSSDGTTSDLSEDEQNSLVAKMKSIQEKIMYNNTDSTKQDPDTGYGSCASTVGWAYRKALGGDFESNQMSANSNTQSNDSRFITVNSGIDSEGNVVGGADTSKLIPGDVLYYKRDNGGGDYNIGHTEMYIGDDLRMGHGGPGLGPTVDKMEWDDDRYVMARRYNSLSGSGRGRNIIGKMRNAVNVTDDDLEVIRTNDDYLNEIDELSFADQRRRERLAEKESAMSRDSNYEATLSKIVTVLMNISSNTKTLESILEALDGIGVNIDKSNLEAAQRRRDSSDLRNIVAKSGRARAGKSRSASNSSSKSSTTAENFPDDVTYIVELMQSLAMQ